MAYSIDRMPERISIGRETETGVTDVMIDCSAWIRKWPGMELHAIHTPEGGAPYILQTETDGGVLVWHVTDADTATPGTGLVEIVGETDGRRKVSAMVGISVAARMPGTVGDPPEAASPWVESVIEAADRITGMRVQAETLDAGSGATAAWDGVQGLLTIGVPKGAKGEKGDTGAQGPKGDTGAQGPQGVTGADGKDAVVDATLTQSGQAADAKVTGDAIDQLKGDKVDKDEILNAGIKSFSYVPMFGGEFTVTTVDEEGYISPHSRASVTGRISKHYTYRITFNGEMYELPCGLYYFKDMGGKGKTVEYLGNLSLYTENTSFSTHDIRNVPFCIISDLDSNSSIDVFTQFPNMNSILVEQIQKEQIVFPKSLVWGDDYCPIEFKRNDGTFSGVSIGLNLLKSTRGTFAVGNGNKVYGDFSQALGNDCEASGKSAMAIGVSTTATGNTSHAEGHNTTATGHGSHAEGNMTTTNGMASHAEGTQTTATGNASHAEGYMTTATGNSSHAEGQKCIANGHISHSGGNVSEANGRASFAHGNFVKATHPSQFVVGYGNNPQEDSIFEVGNGLDANGQPANTGNTEPATRQNAFRVTQSGIAVVKTGLQIGNTIINEEQLQKIITLIN